MENRLRINMIKIQEELTLLKMRNGSIKSKVRTSKDKENLNTILVSKTSQTNLKKMIKEVSINLYMIPIKTNQLMPT